MSTRQNYFFFRSAKSPRPAIPMEGRAPCRKDWKPENWVARTPGRARNCCCATCHSMVIQPREARLRTPRQKSPRKRANSRAKACRAKPMKKAAKEPEAPLPECSDRCWYGGWCGGSRRPPAPPAPTGAAARPRLESREPHPDRSSLQARPQGWCSSSAEPRGA